MAPFQTFVKGANHYSYPREACEAQSEDQPEPEGEGKSDNEPRSREAALPGCSVLARYRYSPVISAHRTRRGILAPAGRAAPPAGARATAWSSLAVATTRAQAGVPDPWGNTSCALTTPSRAAEGGFKTK